MELKFEGLNAMANGETLNLRFVAMDFENGEGASWVVRTHVDVTPQPGETTAALIARGHSLASALLKRLAAT
jgi:hypothetical protein